MKKKDETNENKAAIAKGKAKGNGNQEQDSGAFAATLGRTRSAPKTDGEF